jgi:hypothetical protein
MEVRGQPGAQAAVLRENTPRYTWIASWPSRFGENERILFLPEFEPLTVQTVV